MTLHEEIVSKAVEALEKNPECGWLWIKRDYNLMNSAAASILFEAKAIYKRKEYMTKRINFNWEEKVIVPPEHRFIPELLYNYGTDDSMTVGTFDAKKYQDESI